MSDYEIKNALYCLNFQWIDYQINYNMKYLNTSKIIEELRNRFYQKATFLSFSKNIFENGINWDEILKDFKNEQEKSNNEQWATNTLTDLNYELKKINLKMNITSKRFNYFSIKLY